MKNIVAIVPHPDDLAYGMGGTMLLLKDKYRIYDFCLTKGTRGLSRDPRAETGAIREKEEAAAARLIKAKVRFWGQVDGEVFAGRQICEKLAGALRKLKPAAVFGTWPIDRHPDHAATSEIGRKAFHLARSDAEYYMCEEGLGTQTSQFEPDIYVDITKVMDRKLKMLRCHVCQNREDRLASSARQQFAFRGQQAGCEYAEGFKTLKPLANMRKSILMELLS